MKSFFLMLSFFTRLPVPQIAYEEDTYQKGIKLLPLIGLLIGLILWGISALAGVLQLSMFLPVILPVSYILLTGGIHLDGLADSCDGLFSGRDKEGMLLIMKDSRIGTFGVLSLLIWFVCYMSFYEAFSGDIPLEWLILPPVIGRSAIIVSACAAPYAREHGMGKIFADGCQRKELVWAFIVPAALLSGFVYQQSLYAERIGESLLLLIVKAAAVLVVSCLFVIYITGLIKKKLGGVTGDTYGFVCEVTQLAFMLVYFVVYSRWLHFQTFGLETIFKGLL